MFLVLPTFWLGAMTWAGARVGVAVNGALAGGVKVAQDSGGRLGDDWEVTQLTTRYGGK
ncbi:conjugal transfer protein TraG [Escherichia coli]|nr:conjugal transfer protein TraG [Escherichia coli O19]EFB4828187.1 conjugal transfer protein TraG [Escherichia coli]EGI23946.1 putative membrane protein [Escherichia coli TA206]EFC9695640.1 conjugal transfer protein TraG [Escherichia coli]EFE3366083.1 conjugal transfer protein TraG [Escherichia coli]